MVQIVQHPNFAASMGSALGSGLGEGLSYLAKQKLDSLVKQRQASDFESTLKGAYGEIMSPEEIKVLSSLAAQNPEKAQEILLTNQFSKAKEKDFQAQEQKAREERAKVKAAGLPGSENFSEEEIEAPEIAGRLPRNEREREQFAKMNQKERLAQQAKSENQQLKVDKKNEIFLKPLQERMNAYDKIDPILDEMDSLLNSGKISNGFWGALKSGAPILQNTEEQRLKELIGELQGEKAQELGGVTTDAKLALAALTKTDLWKDFGAQKRNIAGSREGLRRGRILNKAQEQMVAENGGVEPHNLGSKARAEAKRLETLTQEYPPQFETPDSIIELDGKEYKISANGRSWEPIKGYLYGN